MSATEHILLESDDRVVPEPGAARKVHARIGLRSRLRRHAVQLEIIDYYYLSVRAWRSRTPLAPYVIDLRFVDSTPRLARHIAWRWMAAAVFLTALAWTIAAWLPPFGSGLPPHGWLVPFLIAMGSGAWAALTCAYRTHENVAVYSANGAAKLMEFTGGLGTLRALRLFMTRLAAHTRLAAAARRRSRPEHLR